MPRPKPIDENVSPNGAFDWREYSLTPLYGPLAGKFFASQEAYDAVMAVRKKGGKEAAQKLADSEVICCHPNFLYPVDGNDTSNRRRVVEVALGLVEQNVVAGARARARGVSVGTWDVKLSLPIAIKLLSSKRKRPFGQKHRDPITMDLPAIPTVARPTPEQFAKAVLGYNDVNGKYIPYTIAPNDKAVGTEGLAAVVRLEVHKYITQVLGMIRQYSEAHCMHAWGAFGTTYDGVLVSNHGIHIGKIKRIETNRSITTIGAY